MSDFGASVISSESFGTPGVNRGLGNQEGSRKLGQGKVSRKEVGNG